MLETYERFTLPLKGIHKPIIAEVNWDLEDEDIKNCRTIRFVFPDGTKGYMKKDHLFAMLFAMGSEREQEKIVPQTITKTRHYITDLWIKVPSGAKGGDTLKTRVNISLPSVTQEVYADVSRSKAFAEKNLLSKGEVSHKSFVVPQGIKESAKDLQELHKKEGSI